MRRTLLLILFALTWAACGAPADRPRCKVSTDCAAGNYCASGGVCWPDAVVPVITTAMATCPVTPCQRDSQLTVAVQAHDDAALAGVTATLDLDPSRPVTLAPVAGELRATLALGDWPFPAFERPVAVTIRAVDAAGNEASTVVSAGNVTRLRWAVDFAPGELPLPVPAAPAINSSGTALFGAGNGKLHAIGPDGAAVHPPLAVGTVGLTAPVTVDAGGVWVPSDDGKLYRVTGGSTPVVGMACDTGGAVKGVALLDTGEVVAASGAGVVYALSGGVCRNSGFFPGAITLSPVATGLTFVATEGTTLHKFALGSTGIPSEQWSPAPQVGGPPQAPLVGDASGGTWVTSLDGANGSLALVSNAGAATPIATTNAPSGSPVILAGGDLVVPESTRTLSRWSSIGDFRWRSPSLNGVPQAALVMSTAAARLVVADSRGGLTCLDDSGAIAWAGQLAPSSVPLRSANLYTPAGSAFSLAYLPAPNGKLYAVILDGHLDASAPWPKPFHDPANTGNASTVIPTP